MYKCIYADPPWRGNVFWNEQYQTTYDQMSDEQILRMGSEVRRISDPKGCHLWLWTIAGKLGLALDVMKHWGFTESHFVFWAKDWMRMGKLRNQGELLLFCERGRLPISSMEEINWIFTPHWRGVHSEKPDDIRQKIERCSPGPRLEMFARQKPIGREKEWHTWGNDPGCKNDVEIEVPFSLL